MQDAKRVTLTGPALPLRGNDIDTDRIIPARYLRTVTFDGLGEHAFEDDRAQLRESGQTHPFDDERFSQATVLFVNNNFGCGSSREHAPQAIKRWGNGIQVIVGQSFAEIFFGNCIALGIPCLTAEPQALDALMTAVESDPSAQAAVDLQAKTVSVGGLSFPVQIPEGPRQQFLEGRWDTTGELLANAPLVKETAGKLGYFSSYR